MNSAARLNLALCAAVLAVAASCAPLDVAAPPVDKLKLPKKVDRKKLEEGRALYASSCTHCHGPARIDRRSDEKWSTKILPKMCAMSKLNGEQTLALTNYVMTARKALNAPAGN